jgi:hypothetical protein
MMKNPLGSTFLGGAVDEFTTWYTLPDGSMDSGYYIGKSPTWAVQGEVINYLYAPQKVYMDVEYEYVDGRHGTDSMTTILTVTGCSAAPGWPSRGKQSRTVSGEYPLLQDGTIISMRAYFVLDKSDDMDVKC